MTGRGAFVALALIACAAAARAGEALPWSEAPGAYEHHLQRKQDNPLFPPAARRITAEEVRAAQARDRADVEELRHSFDKLVEALARPAARRPPREVIGLFEAVFELRRQAAGIGGPANAMAGALKAIRRLLVEELRARLAGDPAGLRELGRLLARQEALARVVTDPFVAQMQRMDGPVRPEDAVAALLSEPVATIRLFVGILQEETKVDFHERAKHLVERVHFEGNEVPHLADKLAALE